MALFGRFGDRATEVMLARQRADERVDQLSNGMNGMAARLDERIDRTEGKVDRLQQTCERDHERILTSIDEMGEKVKEAVQELHTQYVDLSVKTGAELGKMKVTAEIVEENLKKDQDRRERIHKFLAGGYFHDIRFLVIIGLLLAAILEGHNFNDLISELFKTL